MEQAKIAEPKMTRSEAEVILRNVIGSLGQEQKDNLLHNVKAGCKINCGPRAYVFATENGGDLITLTITTKLPVHFLDLVRIRELDMQAMYLYQLILKRFTLRYYFATQVMDEDSFRNLILNCLEQAA